MKQTEMDLRPDILRSALWEYPDATLAYLEISGQSPERTNHASELTLNIISGIGSIATAGEVIDLKEGDEVKIPIGQPFSYEGEMSLFVYFEPGLNPRAVTFTDKKLNRLFRKLYRAHEREVATYKTIAKLAQSTYIFSDAVSR